MPQAVESYDKLCCLTGVSEVNVCVHYQNSPFCKRFDPDPCTKLCRAGSQNLVGIEPR